MDDEKRDIWANYFDELYFAGRGDTDTIEDYSADAEAEYLAGGDDPDASIPARLKKGPGSGHDQIALPEPDLD
jgi:hypothetical protein